MQLNRKRIFRRGEPCVRPRPAKKRANTRFAPTVVVAVLLALAVPMAARAAVSVQLSLTVNTSLQTFSAFATVIDGSNETLGLHGLEFDVTGSGGLAVTSSGVSLPNPTETMDFSTFYQKGFTVLRSNGTAGQDVRAFQQNVNQLTGTGTGNNNILEGVGEVAFNEANGLIVSTAVAFPVLIGFGQYTGDGGTLTITGSPALTTLLPAALPAATAGGAPFATFSPTTVTGQAVPVPEPTSIATLAVAGLFLLRRATKESADGIAT